MAYFLRFLLFRRFTLKNGSKTPCFGYFFLLFGFFLFFSVVFGSVLCGLFRGASDFFGVVFLPLRRFGGRRLSYGAQIPLF